MLTERKDPLFHFKPFYWNHTGSSCNVYDKQRFVKIKWWNCWKSYLVEIGHFSLLCMEVWWWNNSCVFFPDKHWCTVDWFLFREMGMKCDDDQITPIYSEHPVLDLPSCSLISSYQFLGKSAKQHALLLSGNNPSLMRSFPQGLKIQVRTCSFQDGRVQVTASCKVIQDSLRIRIQLCGFRIPCRWNLDFNR